MTPNKQKYYYAIIKEKDGKPLLSDSKLPIYWSKKVADEFCVGFRGFRVVRIMAYDINRILFRENY